jgi:hypothetical protein
MGRLVRRNDAHLRGAFEVGLGEDLRMLDPQPAGAACLLVLADRSLKAVKNDVICAVADAVDILACQRRIRDGKLCTATLPPREV